MIARFKIFGLALLSGLILTAGGGMSASLRRHIGDTGYPAERIAGVPDRVEVGNLKPLAGPKRETASRL